ncbi:hypothetical protein DRN58_00835, partial [Thermococci archaeon]
MHRHKIGKKSQVDMRKAILLALALSLFAVFSLAHQNFSITTDKTTYYKNQEIYILIQGQENTEFKVKI